MHPTEIQKAKELAAKSGGKYTQQQIEEQMRLMGNALYGESANTTTVLTNTDAIVNNLQNDPGMPKTVQGSVVVEVSGQANAELQNWIISHTVQDAGYIPGQSPYVASNAQLNGPVLTTGRTDASTARCANGDLACLSGVGVQQNEPLSDSTRQAIADGASSVSRQAGVIGSAATAATAAAPPEIKPITGAVAMGATVIGVGADAVEQLVRPDVASSAENAFYMAIQMRVDSSLPIAAPITNEVINAWKNSNTNMEIKEWAAIEWQKFLDSRSKP